MRVEVPTQSAGADRLALVMKPGNFGWSEGVGPASPRNGSTRKGRSVCLRQSHTVFPNALSCGRGSWRKPTVAPPVWIGNRSR